MNRVPAETAARLRLSGYTLLEVLIAMSLFTFLGAGLIALLHRGLELWRTAENRGKTYEVARAALELLAEDLRSAAAPLPGDPRGHWVRFLCDFDERGHQRLRFVRSTADETSDPLLGHAGRLPVPADWAPLDGVRDAEEARAGVLAPPGGLMEVEYAVEGQAPEAVLRRRIRAPAGGRGSLLALGDGEARAWGGDDAGAGPPGMLVAREVLFFGLAFWGPTTTTWDPTAPPLATYPHGRPSGPLFVWDSTRALLRGAERPGEYVFVPRPGSLFDTSDDTLPERVEITLVLHDRSSFPAAELALDAGPEDEVLVLDEELVLPEDPRQRFLFVGSEWVAVERIDGREVTVVKGGRGVRDTRPQAHPAGTPVEFGITFRRVVEVPGGTRLPSGPAAMLERRGR